MRVLLVQSEAQVTASEQKWRPVDLALFIENIWKQSGFRFASCLENGYLGILISIRSKQTWYLLNSAKSEKSSSCIFQLLFCYSNTDFVLLCGNSTIKDSVSPSWVLRTTAGTGFPPVTLFLTCTSAPALTSSLTHCVNPCQETSCSAVFPSSNKQNTAVRKKDRELQN